MLDTLYRYTYMRVHTNTTGIKYQENKDKDNIFIKRTINKRQDSFQENQPFF